MKAWFSNSMKSTVDHTKSAAPSVTIKSLKFRSGPTINIPPDSICVLIGPNNSGKSSILREIEATLLGNRSKNRILDGIEVHRQGSIESVKSLFRFSEQRDARIDANGYTINDREFEDFWDPKNSSIGPNLASKFVAYLRTRERLTACDPPESPDYRDAQKEFSHPFHILHQNRHIENELRDLFRTVFDRDLLLDRLAGKYTPIYVGRRSSVGDVNGPEPLSTDLLKSMTRLETEGDGTRAFVAISAQILTGNATVTLIDEPEAFLHPPHAKIIGNVITDKSGAQTFVATHSSHLIRGLIDYAERSTLIIRVRKQGDRTLVSKIETDLIRGLWNDPIIRYSGVLEGLFHEGVIIAEGDPDCRFYEAIAAAVTPQGQRHPDLHYTFSGGKDRMPNIAQALVGLGVPVVSILDFDVLNQQELITRVYEAHGGNGREIEADWKIVDASIKTNQKYLQTKDVRSEINKIVDGVVGLALSRNNIADIGKILRDASPWDQPKLSGITALKSGDPYNAALRLLEKLKSKGVYVNPHGEMEGFARGCASKGNRWVRAMLERDLKNAEELIDARSFVSEILKYMATSQGSI